MTDGTTRTDGGESFVTIQDNFALDEDEAALASLLPGTLANAWSVSGLSFGAFEEDPNLFDNDNQELVFDGILFEVTSISLDTSLISGLSYNPTPPGLYDIDGKIFKVIEGDSEGKVIYRALGFVDDMTINLARRPHGCLRPRWDCLGSRVG